MEATKLGWKGSVTIYDLLLPFKLRVLQAGTPLCVLRTYGDVIDLGQRFPKDANPGGKWHDLQTVLLDAAETKDQSKFQAAYGLLLETLRDDGFEISERS